LLAIFAAGAIPSAAGYRFLLAENGNPKGVRMFDSYYDPQTAENSVIYLLVNDTPPMQEV
jgi:hypothetical protein